MRDRYVALGCAAAILLWVSQYIADPEGARDGQIVFVPASVIGETIAGSGPSPLTITGCEETPGGLEVRGVVQPDGGTRSVAVTGGDPTAAGVAVGAGFLVNSGEDPMGHPGSFRLILDWADRTSIFAVLGPGTADVPGSSNHLGESKGCPGVE